MTELIKWAESCLFYERYRQRGRCIVYSERQGRYYEHEKAQEFGTYKRGGEMKAEDHEILTEKAIKLFCANSTSRFSKDLEHYMNTVIRGSKDADLTPYLTRITNWHFFKENDRLAPKQIRLLSFLPLLTIHPTSDNILKRRITELKSEFQKGVSKKLFQLVGRVLHHIQDMSTPSHVVPVYHGFNIKDSFEVYSEKQIHKSIEELPFSDTWIKDSLSENNVDLYAIYKNSALYMLNYLFDSENTFDVEVNGKIKTISWGYFWERNHMKKSEFSHKEGTRFQGFGRFGVLGKYFGATNPKIGETNRYNIPDNIYSDLHKKIVEKSIGDSLSALSYINKNISN